MQQQEFALARVVQVAVTVQDLDRAVACYRDQLGLPLQLQVPNLAIFDCDGLRLMLSPPEGEFTNNASILYFDVPNVNEAYHVLRSRGIEFIDMPHKVADWGAKQLWMAFFRDSERNVMALVEERAVA